MLITHLSALRNSFTTHVLPWHYDIFHSTWLRFNVRPGDQWYLRYLDTWYVPGKCARQCMKHTEIWALFQYPIRRLIVRCRGASKPRNLCLELFDRSEIWQAHRQQCCWDTCQISKRYNNSNYQYRVFETSWDLMIRHFSDTETGPRSPLSYKCHVCSDVQKPL